MSAGKVLFIDAYDSFSNNIINLLRDRLSVTVSSIYIDDPRFVFNDDAFHEHLQQFDAVVAGPGPGHPANPQDIGLIAKLWTLADENVLPVLGICLGFQSLCLAYGGTVDRLKQPRHGLVTPITHCGGDVYADTGHVRATQYHSLHVSIGLDDNGARSDKSLFTPTKTCPQLCPLAWDLSDPENGPIFMSTKHVSKPFTGVQYHPESICTNDEGHKLVDKWWQAACTWNARNRTDDFFPPLGASRPSHHTNGHAPKSSSHDSLASSVHWTSFNPGKPLDAASVVQALRSQTHPLEPLLLESGTRASGEPVNPETGRFSIIGLQEASSTHVRYSTSNHLVQVTNGSNMPFKTSVTTPEVFTILETLVQSRRALGGPSPSPFWGGFIGFISYEAGLETIDVTPPEPFQERPDIWFVFVERSIVIDHVEGQVYIQTLHQNDDAWLAATKTLLSSPTNAESAKPKPSNGTTTKHPAQITSQPSRAEYQAKVHACQSHLRAGSSYELCLTDSTSIRTPESAWSLYQRLRAANPAPFSAYLNFAGVTFHPIDGSATPSGDSIQIVGSSPERFLSWTRDSGRIQFRPIKGTVKKTPTTTRAMAEELLKSPKEQAENLMIVDLIRHDLSGVQGVSAIHVPHLMAVEEYATVYQLVSVIAGTLDPDAPTTKTGLNVLAASLPPGSMTGAPKKRSCALLAGIEGREKPKPRGVYSGVLGYLDVGGGGDFSVVIRTAFRYGGGGAGEGDGDWQIGAGGAVTVLSEAEAEWEEMLAKRESLLKVFGGGVDGA